jgi:myo-inositol 2-dehydrogenase / D-chiro-inositol 1-dehydrogenase
VVDFCLVGAGFIGPVHAANVAAHPRARLSGVIDLNLDAADALGMQGL